MSREKNTENYTWLESYFRHKKICSMHFKSLEREALSVTGCQPGRPSAVTGHWSPAVSRAPSLSGSQAGNSGLRPPVSGRWGPRCNINKITEINLLLIVIIATKFILENKMGVIVVFFLF